METVSGERPTRQQVIDWWTEWPDAGIAVILGPVSNLLFADVRRRTCLPDSPRPRWRIPAHRPVKSGGVDDFRFHLYFRHPADIATAASKTPFNNPDDKGKLELRGDNGASGPAA